jgi:hypothetical protein
VVLAGIAFRAILMPEVSHDYHAIERITVDPAIMEASPASAGCARCQLLLGSLAADRSRTIRGAPVPEPGDIQRRPMRRHWREEEVVEFAR